MSLSAVGGDAWCLLPSRRRHPADAHYQGAIRVDGSADRQGVHVLGEKGLVGKSVADAPVIQDLQGRGGGGEPRRPREEEGQDGGVRVREEGGGENNRQRLFSPLFAAFFKSSER